MATLKAVVLKHHQKEDGTFNVKIRITHNRQACYIPTQFYITSKQLNRNLEIVDNFLLMSIDSLINNYRKTIIQLSQKIELLTAKEVAELLQDEARKEAEIDFYSFAIFHANKIIDRGQKGTGGLFISTINNMKEFTGNKRLFFSEITVKFLNNYEYYLQTNGFTPSGISLYMRNIRALFNQGRDFYNDEERGVIAIPHYPFSKYKIPMVPETKKRNLKPELIKQIRDLSLNLNRDKLARDVFMLSIYLVGINTVDLYNCDKIEDGRLVYNRTKTQGRRKDSAFISIKIEPEAMALINKYRDNENQRIFNFYHTYADKSNFNSNINKGLKNIGDLIGVPDLSTYYARHSWATIARNQCKVSKDDVALALNHVDSNNKTTDIYIEKDFTLIDEANRKVLDLLL